MENMKFLNDDDDDDDDDDDVCDHRPLNILF